MSTPASSRFTFAAGPHRPGNDAPSLPDDNDLVWFRDAAGLVLGLRPIHPDDKGALLQGFEQLSEESRYQRFLAPMERLTARQLRYLTEIDHINHFAWAAGYRDEAGQEHGVGVARFVRDLDDPCAAELAVVVADDFQGRGIGTLLIDALVVVATDQGVERMTGFMFAENNPMIRIFKRLGAVTKPDSPGVLSASLTLPATGVTITAEGVEELLWVAQTAAHPSHRPCR